MTLPAPEPSSSIAIVGKPNSGKSLLFNKLTGLKQKVTNYPGITVDVKSGHLKNLTLFDFPGIYTFNSLSKDEVIAVQKFVEALQNKKIDKIVCVLDGTKLSSSLLIGLEIQHKATQEDVPVIFALNMMDELEKNDLNLDVEGLAADLQSAVVPISARSGQGLQALQETINSDLSLPGKIEDFDFYNRALELSKKYGPKIDVLFLKQQVLDRFFLSPVFGLASFVFIMLVLFQAIFSWSVPFMDLIEWAINGSGQFVGGLLPKGIIRDFTVDALFGGVGSFLVFVPQIFFLTFIIGFLEDSGYLARSAMICHKPLKFFGLSGKSFIAMLTGHACAIPAIFASRTIESPKRRFLTILTVPLMSCSARLPVYALLVAAIIPPTTFLGGLIGLQSMTFLSLYVLGIAMALLVALFFSKMKLGEPQDVPFIMELPPYRLPNWRPLISRSLQSSSQFVTNAGQIIFSVTIVIWILGYFPDGSGHLETSWLASMGHSIEPFLRPLGLDWKYGVAILTSFLAREVFVGTLGTMFGIDGADDNIAGLAENIQASGLTLSSGLALLVFYAIALQCVSTLAVMKRELGSTRIPVLIFIFYSALAYLCAWAVFQFASFLF